MLLHFFLFLLAALVVQDVLEIVLHFQHVFKELKLKLETGGKGYKYLVSIFSLIEVQ